MAGEINDSPSAGGTLWFEWLKCRFHSSLARGPNLKLAWQVAWNHGRIYTGKYSKTSVCQAECRCVKAMMQTIPSTGSVTVSLLVADKLTIASASGQLTY